MKVFIFFVVAFVLANMGTAQDVGYFAEKQQFPSLVQLITLKNNQIKSFCSGTIVSNTWVLTSARCVKDGEEKPDVIYAQLGQIQLSLSAPLVKIDVNGDTVIIHEDYDSKLFTNNLALIYIEIGQFDASINKVFLNEDQIGVNTELIGAGLNTSYPSVQWYDLNVVDNRYCKHMALRELREGEMCVAETHSATCNGKTGSPAYYMGKLAGIGSQVSDAACNENLVSVYSNVTYYKDWIYNFVIDLYEPAYIKSDIDGMHP